MSGNFYFAGYDPAKISDGSGFCIVERFPDKSLEPRMLLNLRGIGYTEQAGEIIRICKYRNVTRLAMDSTSHEPVRESLYKSLGGRVLGISFTRQIKEEMILDLRIAFQDGQIRIGKNFKHYNLLRRELHELDPKKLDHPPKGSSDLCWALALACHAAKFNYIKARRLYLPHMER